MCLKTRFAVGCLVLGVLLACSPAIAQQPDDQGDDPTAATQPEPPPEEKMPFALYVQAATGVATVDTLETSIQTLVLKDSVNSLDLEDAQIARGAIGWKLPNAKGDLRLIVNNFKEDGYDFAAAGRLGWVVDPDPLAPISTPTTACDLDDPACEENVTWWTLTASDGLLTSVQQIPYWSLANDTDGDGKPDPDELVPGPTTTTTRSITEDLENRAQNIDLLYGRTFGRRRYSARWWAGLRYFTYEGNVPTAAWLEPQVLSTNPVGYTEGNLLRLLNFQQESSGLGPTGILEADFNFFDQRVQFYVQGQAAFTVLQIETDSGPFSTMVRTADPAANLLVDARLQTDRNKSTWQNALEAGVRVNLKNGVGFELAYNLTGYLDIILLPTEIRIPETQQEAAQGTSAIYNTQDVVLDGWRAGVSFQF